MLAQDVANQEFDKSQRMNKVWAADLGVRFVRASLLRDVLHAAGLYEPKANEILDRAEVEQATLEPFVIALHKRKQQLQSVFEMLPRKDADTKRVQQLSVVLDKIGLRLGPAKESDAGGKKVRRYQLDVARLARLRGIMRQRAESQANADSSRGISAPSDGIDAGTMQQIKARLKEQIALFRAMPSGWGATEETAK